MPTVLRIGGYAFRIYLSDHEPAHVHVFSAGAEAIIQFGESQRSVLIRQNRGMTQRDLWRELLDRWDDVHGKA